MRERSEFPFVTVIMPVRNEERHIERSLGAILGQDYPHDRYEVLVVDGMSTDRTREIVQRLARTSEVTVRILDNPREIVPCAMNTGIRAARGDIIVRMDGHTVAHPDYLAACVEALRSSGADAVGGRMTATGETLFGEAVAIATSTPFGVGNAKFHYAERAQYVDTAYLGCWPKDTFNRYGLFDEEFVRTQDSEFHYRIRLMGGRVWYTPAIRSVYYCRSTMSKLARQYFQYGEWKFRLMRKHGGNLLWRHYVPPLFVLALVASLICMGFGLWRHSLWLLLAGSAVPIVYLVFLMTAGAYVMAGEHRSWKLVAPVLAALATIHIAWGTGFLVGLGRELLGLSEGDVPHPSEPGTGGAASDGVRVVHFDTVHPWDDTRIFYKECRTLGERGYHVSLVATPSWSGQNPESRQYPVQVTVIPTFASRWKRALLGMPAAVFSRFPRDWSIMHFHSPELIPWMLGMKFLYPERAIIFDMHENFLVLHRTRNLSFPAGIFLRPLARMVLTLAEEFFDAIIIAEDSYLSEFRRTRPVSVRNFPSRQLWEQACRGKETPFGAGGGGRDHRVRLVYVGGISRKRGLFTMLEVARILQEQGAPFLLHILGQFRLRNELREARDFLSRVGIEEDVLLTEKQIPYPEALTILSQADIGLCLLQPDPNYVESLPTKLLEYMLAGIPAVVSDFPLWRQVVTKWSCGVAVDPQDPTHVADEILKLIERKDLREEMGRNGRDAVLQNFLWEREAGKLLDLYEGLRPYGPAGGLIEKGTWPGRIREQEAVS